jgi:uncharacterized protein YecT (DUF1311 family)
MILTLFLPLALQSAQAPTQPPVRGWDCDSPLVQQEMNWCAAQDYQAADAELNAQWAITAAAMKARDADFAAYGSDEYDKREGYFATLLEGQRGWLRYRDGQCAIEGYSACGGSMEPMLVSGCKTRLTRQRTAELRELAEFAG